MGKIIIRWKSAFWGSVCKFDEYIRILALHRPGKASVCPFGFPAVPYRMYGIIILLHFKTVSHAQYSVVLIEHIYLNTSKIYSC